MADGFLTTHVLDTARGLPAAGIEILLYKVSGNSHKKIASMTTNDDGRTDSPILPKDKFKAGQYELIFKVGDYLRAHGLVEKDAENLFLDEVPIRFGVNDDTSHYHVPLLISPYGYSTYRGS
ncbi:hydroxyisourate hydrolase [Ahrensia marina]|uniref:5-hydroxyisourate hydrolase n=1 Tax=Ahrensia marina TaxID=1514904 RepID=A0A0M9GQ21_9HYPH|nr:hydroxyisourate hydrolase [Ahrensia marina]KPB02749.1 5-hydroxyisourate hydrolase [Ahrensia marina]